MIDQQTIRRAASLLQQAAPGSRVILFGSYARGDANAQSDVDFLVVEPEVPSKRREMVRLRDVLRPLGIPVDILVTTQRLFEEWRDTPNNVLFQAASEGRLFDEVA